LPLVAILGAVACLYTMKGLPVAAWKRFGEWLVIGLAIYFLYSLRHSTLRRGSPPEPVVAPPPIEK
jgi:APA family basic amino acid/polyamine antiporter